MKFRILFISIFLFYNAIYSQSEAKLKLTCKQVERKNEEGLENIIVKTCYLKNYKFVATGLPDYKGRYHWEYSVYKLVNKKFKLTRNSAIFNNIKRLENLVNDEIKKSYESDKKIKEIEDCVNTIKYRQFAIDEMGIDFDENNNMVFNTSFELSSACLNVDLSIIPISLIEIKPYLK